MVCFLDILTRPNDNSNFILATQVLCVNQNSSVAVTWRFCVFPRIGEVRHLLSFSSLSIYFSVGSVEICVQVKKLKTSLLLSFEHSSNIFNSTHRRVFAVCSQRGIFLMFIGIVSHVVQAGFCLIVKLACITSARITRWRTTTLDVWLTRGFFRHMGGLFRKPQLLLIWMEGSFLVYGLCFYCHLINLQSITLSL